MPTPQQLAELEHFPSAPRTLPRPDGSCSCGHTACGLRESYFLAKFFLLGRIALSISDRIIAGYANVEIVDEQGELIPAEAWPEAFRKFMANPKFRLVHVFHTDIPVGEVIPQYRDIKGRVWKSHADDRGLFIVVRIRTDLVAADRVWAAIESGELRSFSISGLALERRMECRGGRCYRVIPRLELHSITICEKGANPPSRFFIVKILSLERVLKLEGDRESRMKMSAKEELDLGTDLAGFQEQGKTDTPPAPTSTAPKQEGTKPPAEVAKQSQGQDLSPVLLEMKAGIEKAVGLLEKVCSEMEKAKKPEYPKPEEKAEKKPEKYPYPEEKAGKKEEEEEDEEKAGKKPQKFPYPRKEGKNEEEEEEEEKARKKPYPPPARKGEVLAVTAEDLAKMVDDKVTEVVSKMLGKTERRGTVPDTGAPPTGGIQSIQDLTKMPLAKLGTMTRQEFFHLLHGGGSS